MKKIKLIALTAMLFVSGISVKAQDLKIGYVNVEYVLSVWPAVKAVQSEMKTYEEQLMKDIQAKQGEYQAKVQEYERTKAILTDPKRQALEVEIQSLVSQIQLYQKNAQIELLNKQQEKLNPLFTKVSETISEVAKELNYTHVFNQTIEANSILLYAKNEEDNLSKAVMKKIGIAIPAETASQK